MSATPQRPVTLGRHRVTGRLGRGGMGVVFDAMDLEARVPVALKVLSHHHPGATQRFKAEFRAVAGIAHPHLVTMFGMHTDLGLLYLSMERVEGVDWRTWVRGEPGDPLGATPTPDPTWPTDLMEEPVPRRPVATGPPRSYAVLRAALVQLLRGVAALHRHGRVHLDIKPSNVLVEPSTPPRVVLLDFGLVTRTLQDTLPSHNVVGGTPRYMAPEQSVDAPLTPAADLYAIGVMLYEGLTGEGPFAPGPPVRVLADKARGPERSPRDVVPQTPEDLDRLAMALLEPRPERRPTLEQVLEALGEAAPVAPRDPPLMGRQEELASWLSLVDAPGPAQLLDITGPPGVGKTRTLRAFLRACRFRHRAWTFHGTGFRAEFIPYGGIDQVLDQLAGHLARLPSDVLERYLPADRAALVASFPTFQRIPELRRFPLGTASPQGTAALAEILQRIAAKRPLVVAIDDLQWCGGDAAALLDDLLACLKGPVLFVVTQRPADAERLRAASRGRQVHHRLRPLLPSTSRALACSALQDMGADPVLADQVVRSAGGNPRQLLGVARLLGMEAVDVSPGGVLRQLAEHRIAALGPAARDLLQAVSMAVLPTDPAALADLAGLGVHPSGPLTELQASGLVALAADTRELGTRVVTAYDEVGHACLASVAPAARQELSARFFRRLVPQIDDDRELFAAVGHALAAGPQLTGDERYEAAGLALQAARQATRRGSRHLAHRLAGEALVLLPDDVPDDVSAPRVEARRREALWLGAEARGHGSSLSLLLESPVTVQRVSGAR